MVSATILEVKTMAKLMWSVKLFENLDSLDEASTVRPRLSTNIYTSRQISIRLDRKPKQSILFPCQFKSVEKIINWKDSLTCSSSFMSCKASRSCFSSMMAASWSSKSRHLVVRFSTISSAPKAASTFIVEQKFRTLCLEHFKVLTKHHTESWLQWTKNYKTFYILNSI